MNKPLLVNTCELMVTRDCNLNCKYCFEKIKNKTTVDVNKIYNILTDNGKNYILPLEKFYMLGGEPTLNLKGITDIVDKIKNDNTISNSKKNTYIKSAVSNLISNGTILDKLIKPIVDYNFSFQISLDGPKEINDNFRVDYNEKGHFDDIMNNIKLLSDNNIKWSVHGAIDSKNLKYLFDINKWYIDMYLYRFKNSNKENDLDTIETMLKNNYCQYVFESDYTDEEIDFCLKAFYDTVEYILYSDVLNDYNMSTRKHIAEGFLVRKGGICGMGTGFFAIDNDLYVYPCHRWMASDEDSQAFYQINSNNDKNYYYYEQLIDICLRHKMDGAMYESDFRDNCKKTMYEANWCPSTNWNVTNNVSVLPPKYTVFLAELNNYIPKLAEYFDLDLNYFIKKKNMKKLNKV